MPAVTKFVLHVAAVVGIFALALTGHIPGEAAIAYVLGLVVERPSLPAR